MKVFTDQTARFNADERTGTRTGELYVFCEIRVKGNHLKGPVNVEINRSYVFTYDSTWSTEEGFEVAQTKDQFNSASERNSAVETRYTVHGDWITYSKRFSY